MEQICYVTEENCIVVEAQRRVKASLLETQCRQKRHAPSSKSSLPLVQEVLYGAINRFSDIGKKIPRQMKSHPLSTVEVEATVGRH